MEQKQENVLFGIVGAFLFSLAGGVLWYVLDKVGFVAGISGLVGVVCAIKGYSVFAKGESKKGVILSTVIAALVLVLAWYISLSMDLYDVWKEWFRDGEVDWMASRWECVSMAWQLLSDSEVATPYFGNLVLGLGFCVISSFSAIRNAVKRAKQAEDATLAENAPFSGPTDFTVDAERTPDDPTDESNV